MMRTIHWHLETSMNGGDLSGTIEVDDDATAEDIEAAVREDMWNWLSLSWREEEAAA